MAEESNKDKYIICSKCKCKYINDDEHIKADFGYNRLEQRFKCCVKCRDRTKRYKKEHKEERAEYDKQYEKDRREKLKKLAEESNGKLKHCHRCYKNKSLDEFVCPDNGRSYGACYVCLVKRFDALDKLNLNYLR